jgi:formylglycine-generating enzyme required for sulfatase activity/dienelactone hydrolase
MTPERWQRLEEIFHAARGQDPAARAAYLGRACGDDESLRRQIESLLAHGDAVPESGVGTTVAPTAMPAAMVGPYRIEERLDAGGMGVVYRALDTRLGRQVAIKVGFAQFSDRFYREARTVARLNHVNVCTLHDIGSTPDIPGYLVMEFVEGPTLAATLARGPLPLADAMQIARQMAAALAAAHQHGIVHRDLKPANVKITPQGVVKVLDFGLAKDFPGSVPAPGAEASATAGPVTDGVVTVAGTVLGTAAYMSPEQASGREADARSDIFSFGIVLYEMLCGRRPFAGKTSAEVIASVLRGGPEPPRRLRADISERLERILLTCLEPDPAARYASGVELQDDLEALIDAPQAGRFVSLKTALATAAVLTAVAGGYVGWQSYRRHADLRWLDETAVPQIATLLQQGRALDALTLYRQAERIAPDSKLLYTLAEGVASRPVNFETTPSGATIYVSDYAAGLGDDLSRWQFVGTAPVTLAELPSWGYYRVRAVKEGFGATDRVFGAATTVQIALHENGTAPPGMVWVPSAPATAILPTVALPGFWIDRYEVTNRQFLEFLKHGGYRRKDYWKEPFVMNGRSIPWEQAMSEFHDLTGQPGPANWKLGAYPEGEADLPVAGVSWYEAMAYAEFAGKSIPTVYEWRHAAPVEFNADVVLMSNFSGKGLTPAGAHHGMTRFGAYDMAGNVKEWTANASGMLRYAMGGAWDESSYVFSVADARDPFWRTVSMGFRTVKRPTAPPPASFAALQLAPPHVRTEKPVDDQTFRILADLHRYEPSPLEASVDRPDASPPFWTRETVSFKAAYANERVIAHLFLPKDVAPPYQVVVVFGGSGIMQVKRVEDFGFPYEFLIRSGRAVMIPAYWGTLDRGPSALGLPANEEIDRAIKWSRDLGRSIDYLQTRPDIDASRLGFYGLSWGAAHAPRLLSVETRVKAAALLSGGLLASQPREVDSWNFAPRYRVPTLMVNGRQDFITPYETSQKPLFDALGTPAADKKLVLYEGGHRNPVTRPDLLGEIIAWFDRYLGPVLQEP